ncbi:MAG: DUF4367 domain-containing protein, partial [Ruminococcus sp.]|nr:DUF4367 domain-containing protein [Ruminococcus sp.]
QPTVYAAVENVMRTVFDEYDQYEFEGEDISFADFDNSIRLGYVPEGFYLVRGDYLGGSVHLTYSDKNDENEEKIIFDYGIADGSSISLDNEHNIYSVFTLNGIEYHYYESTDENFYDVLMWYKDGYVFSIFAQTSKEELVKIAENLK